MDVNFAIIKSVPFLYVSLRSSVLWIRCKYGMSNVESVFGVNTGIECRFIGSCIWITVAFNASSGNLSSLNPGENGKSYFHVTLWRSIHQTRQQDTMVDMIGAGTFWTSLDHLIIWSTSKAPASLGLHSLWVWGLSWDGHEMVKTQVEFKHWCIDLAVGQLSQTIAVLTYHVSLCTFLHGWWMRSSTPFYSLSRLHNTSWPLLRDWEASCNPRSSSQVSHMCELRFSCDNFQTVIEST